MANEILTTFQSFRTILCICPCCGEIMRLSDLQLEYQGDTKSTWLDDFEKKILKLQEKEEKFDEKEQEIRNKAAEKGRLQVPKIISKCMVPKLKELKYDPYDIKAIFHPVDFVVFNGMNTKDVVKEVAFLSCKDETQNFKSLRQSIKKTIDNKSYEWKIAQVSIEGKIEYK